MSIGPEAQVLMTNQIRRENLVRFYFTMEKLAKELGGARKLADCAGHMEWPKRGVYFFYEQGENRSAGGSGPRVVRVGNARPKGRVPNNAVDASRPT